MNKYRSSRNYTNRQRVTW